MTDRKPPHVPHVALEGPAEELFGEGIPKWMRGMRVQTIQAPAAKLASHDNRIDPLAEVDRLGLWLNLHGRAGDWSASVYAGPVLRGVGTGATAGEAVRRAIEEMESKDE